MASSTLTWVLLDTLGGGKQSLVGACFAVVAGLAAIAPAATLVSLPGAMAIGASSALLCRCALRVRLSMLDSPVPLWNHLV